MRDDDACERDFGTGYLGTQQRMPLDRLTVDAVNERLPTRDMLPNSRMMASTLFADRLGVFLTDGDVRPSGTYPTPDNNQVTIHYRATIHARDGAPESVIRAAPSWHGKPAYSFVEIRGAGGSWYAQVILLFAFKVGDVPHAAALVNYLEEVPALRSTCPNKTCFRWYSRYPDCVDLREIARCVVIAHIAWLTPRDGPRFVLLDY